MTKLILLFILSIGLQVAGADVDAALQSFLASTMGRSSAGANPEAVKKLFNLYKGEFDHNFETAREDKLRLSSFNETLKIIIDHHRAGERAFTLGLNQYADWTQDELSQLRGVRIPRGEINETNAKPGDRFSTWNGKSAQGKSLLATSFDFTERVVSGTSVPVIGAIKSQVGCGSCYAFALITLLEFQYAVQLKSSRSLSEQQMVDCSTKDKGCNGGYFTNTFSYLQSNNWAVDGETTYPYKAVASSCAFRGVGGVRFGSLLYKQVNVNNAVAMQEALVAYGPLWISLFVGDQTTSTYRTISSLFYAYKNGVFQPSGCPTSVMTTNHAVVIVGYGVDATTNLPYWKVRNSWGTGWSESGYFRIRRGVNMCGVESGAFYVAKPA